jgi:hypothetical protein
MKRKYADYSLDEIPELEETEFVFSARPRFEDSNDVGNMGDSISFSVDLGDALHSFDA